MRHLLKYRTLGDVLGHDATERVQDLFAVCGGQGRP
jgi:hypothetical protein